LVRSRCSCRTLVVATVRGSGGDRLAGAARPGRATVRVTVLVKAAGRVGGDQPQASRGRRPRGCVEVYLVQWRAGAVQEVLATQLLSLGGGVRVAVADGAVELDCLCPTIGVVVAHPAPARVAVERASYCEYPVTITRRPHMFLRTDMGSASWKSGPPDWLVGIERVRRIGGLAGSWRGNLGA